MNLCVVVGASKGESNSLEGLLGVSRIGDVESPLQSICQFCELCNGSKKIFGFE